jgi:RNA polymerase sigma factor for flagellar operon FliA
MELDEASLKEFAVTVKFFAMRYAHRLPPEIDVDDLVSVGMTGLIDAAKRFDPSRGIKFKTMAEHRIRGAMLDEIRSADWVPRSVREKASSVHAVREGLRAALLREPDDMEMAKALSMSLDEYLTLENEIEPHHLYSIEDLFEMEEGAGSSILDRMVVPGEADPLSEFLKSEEASLLEKALDSLPEKQRLVLSLYYYEELSMKEVAAVLEVSESRVSQIHTLAIKNLKKALLSLGHKES